MNKKQENWKKIEWPSLQTGHVPPKAPQAEAAVLGAILLEKNAFDIAAQLITAEHFYEPAYGTIFKAAQSLSNKNQPIDMVTVANELLRIEKLEEVGGPALLAKLTNAVTSGAHIEAHAKIIYEKWIRRQLITACMVTAGAAYSEAEDTFDLVDDHNAKVGSLTLTRSTAPLLGDVLFREMTRIVSLRQREDHLTGVPTGFATLDKTTGGWQDTDLIILAARPSVGKTAFALNLARNAATHPIKPTPVGVFSLEMSVDQLVRRIISAESGIPIEKLNMPKRLREEEVEAVYNKGVQQLEDVPLYIDDTPGLSLHELKAKARIWKRDHNIGLLIVDYLQLMSGDRSKGSTREQEISNISRGLKGLAKELKIPVIALSQLTRENEKQGREPRLSDLRDGGSIEQDADMVAFLTRSDYQQDGEQEGEISNQAWVIIKKHRNGPLDRLPFYTALEIQRWMTPLEWDTYQANKQALNILPPGNWRAADTGARLFIQSGADRPKDRNANEFNDELF